MKDERVEFYSEGQKIVGIIHNPEKKRTPAIILCHGLEGNKDEEHKIFIKAAEKFCNNGFTVLRFDFRGSGESEGEHVDMTISSEVEDLRKAVEFIKTKDIDTENIGVLGLSLGASVSVLSWNESVKTLVLWSPANPNEKTFVEAFGKKTFEEIEKKGFYDLKYNEFGWKTERSFKIGRNFLNEVKRTNLEKNITLVKCPTLIIQGTDDEVIDVEDTKRIFHNANEPKEIKMIEGANHTFCNIEHEKKVIDYSLEWFNRELK